MSTASFKVEWHATKTKPAYQYGALDADQLLKDAKTRGKAKVTEVTVTLKDFELTPKSFIEDEHGHYLVPTFTPGSDRAVFKRIVVQLMCWSCILGGVIVGVTFVAVQHWTTSDSDADEEAVNVTPPPPPPPLAFADNSSTAPNCTALLDVTADISPLVRNEILPTFFNTTCLAAGGTGDPCDLRVAVDYTRRMFMALRFTSISGVYISYIISFCLAQLGGIPRATDWNGMLFWLAWMATLIAQYTTTFCALLMHVFAFFGVRARTRPCLIEAEGVLLLDYYAATTFVAQPPLLSLAMLLFSYSFLISLGMYVFDGSRKWPWQVKARPRFMSQASSVVEVVAEEASVADEPLEHSTVDISLARSPSAVGRRCQPSRGTLEAAARSGSQRAITQLAKMDENASTLSVSHAGTDAPTASHSNAGTEMSAASISPPPSPPELDIQSRVLHRLTIAPIDKRTFVKDAMEANLPNEKVFRDYTKFALPHYYVARVLPLGTAFSAWAALGSPAAIVPGVVASWCMAVVVASLIGLVWWLPSVRKSLRECEDWAGAKCYMSDFDLQLISSTSIVPAIFVTIIFCPLLSASALLPLAALFWLLVFIVYRVSQRVLKHIKQVDDETVWIDASGTPLNLPCCLTWVQPLAGVTRTSLGWLGALATFRHLHGLTGRAKSEYLAFTSTSFATLAGGITCFSMMLAMAPIVSFNAWARAQWWLVSSSLDEVAVSNVTDEGVVNVTAFRTTGQSLAGDWSWVWDALMPWLWLGVAVVVPCCSVVLVCGVVALNVNTVVSASIETSSVSDTTKKRAIDVCQCFFTSVCVVLPCCLLLFIFTASQTAAEKERIAIAHASTFEGLGDMYFEWDSLLPSFEELAEVLSDPAGALSSVIQRLADLSHYADFDPEHFLNGARQAQTLNFVLSFVKFVAAYGRKLFALLDTAKAILKTNTGYEAASEGGDGTVQVYETVTDLVEVRVADLRLKLGETGSVAVIAQRTHIGWSRKNLNDGDAEALGRLIEHVGSQQMSAESLDLRENHLGPAAARTVASWLKTSAVLTNLNLHNNNLGPTGATAIAEALASGKAVLTSLNVGFNNLDEEAALGIVRAARQHNKMTNLGLEQCKIDTTGAKEIAQYAQFSAVLTSLDLCDNWLGPEGAAAIAEALKSGEAVLKKIVLSQNKIEDEGAIAIGESLKTNTCLEELELSRCGIGVDGAKAIAQSGMAVLTSLDISSNGIETEGAKAFAEALKANAVLTNLSVAYSSDINGEAAQQLAAAALGSKSLEVLSHVPIKELREDKHISLGLCGKGLGPTEAFVLRELIKVTAKLWILDISENLDLGDEGVLAIAEAIEKAPSSLALKMLYVSQKDTRLIAACKLKGVTLSGVIL